MRNRAITNVLVLVGLLIVSAPLFAHHGNAAYDNRTVTVKGTITAWLWTNPHSFLKFDVKDDTGKVTHWSCEWNTPSTLVHRQVTQRGC